MPIYTWVCNECQHITEIHRSMKEYETPPDDGCDKCKSKNLQRTLQATSFSLIGQGWFRDGYRGAGKK